MEMYNRSMLKFNAHHKPSNLILLWPEIQKIFNRPVPPIASLEMQLPESAFLQKFRPADFINENPDLEILPYAFTDRFGVECYKGDIVKWDDGSNGKYWRVAIVDVDNVSVELIVVKNTLYPVSSQYPYRFNMGNFNALKIIENIGSIFTTPHLITEFPPNSIKP